MVRRLAHGFGALGRVLLSISLLTGCQKLLGKAHAEPAPQGSGGATHGGPSEPTSHEKAEVDSSGSGKYALPFAWEVSKDEPLARTRAFLRELARDNSANMKRGAAYFDAFARAQTPRATVVTCADSRVHSQAWDATPDNDDFTIRNIGNQVSNAHGSVEYGLEHLHTPLLLIIGHTGCGAVKAAMGDLATLPAPIRDELKDLKVPAAKPGQSEDRAWADAVVANVNNQVTFTVEHFGKLVQEGNLTVVGAVYDFRNDLDGGAGKLHVVNVNANTEPARLEAFSAAVLAGQPATASGSAPEPKSENTVTADKLAEIISKTPGMVMRDPGHASEPVTPQATSQAEHGH